MEPIKPPPPAPPSQVRPPSKQVAAVGISADALKSALSKAKPTTTIVTLKDGSRHILTIQEDGTEVLTPEQGSSSANTVQLLAKSSDFEPQTKPIPKRCPHRWDGSNWTHVSLPYSDIESSPKLLEKLKCMTYNVWFEPFALERRASELFRIIDEKKPDIICLQEVTKPFLECLKNSSAMCLRPGAIVSDILGESFSSYGVIIIVNNPSIRIRSFSTTSFPSGMGRCLLTCEISLNDSPALIGTSHLESLNSAPTRHQQLQIASTTFAKSENCFFMGDFNLDIPIENENLKKTMVGWTDAWETIHPGDEGKTFDTLGNPMLKTYGFERARYDRVMFKSALWIGSSIEMIGKTAFGVEQDTPLLPSDHYGLFAEFVPV